MPAAFKNMLLYGKNHIFKTEERKTEQQKIAGFLSEKAIFYNNNICQQESSSDCGWWAVWNAIEVVKTGNADFLEQFRDKKLKPATKLRKKFPRLATDIEVKKGNEIEKSIESKENFFRTKHIPFFDDVEDNIDDDVEH